MPAFQRPCPWHDKSATCGVCNNEIVEEVLTDSRGTKLSNFYLDGLFMGTGDLGKVRALYLQMASNNHPGLVGALSNLVRVAAESPVIAQDYAHILDDARSVLADAAKNESKIREVPFPYAE